MNVRWLVVPALVAAAGCSQFQPASLAEATIVSKETFQAGYADIGAVGVVASNPGTYRLYLSMADGHSQTLDVDNPTFMVDQRVEVTPEGRIALLSGTTFKR